MEYEANVMRKTPGKGVFLKLILCSCNRREMTESVDISSVILVSLYG